MPLVVAVQTVPIVAGLILAVLMFSGWVYAMIRIDPDEALVGEQGTITSNGNVVAGEREWLKVPPVRPGGVCQVPGSVGSTATGVAMLCTPEADGTARWRWRQPNTRSA